MSCDSFIVEFYNTELINFHNIISTYIHTYIKHAVKIKANGSSGDATFASECAFYINYCRSFYRWKSKYEKR